MEKERHSIISIQLEDPAVESQGKKIFPYPSITKAFQLSYFDFYSNMRKVCELQSGDMEGDKKEQV